MSNTISVNFVHGAEVSVTLFAQWDGMALIQHVSKWAGDRQRTYPRGYRALGGHTTPLERRNPQTCMVDFIGYLLREQCIEYVVGNYYLGVSKNDGDNQGYGHWTYDLLNEEWWPNDWRGFCRLCDTPIHFKHLADRLCDDCKEGV